MLQLMWCLDLQVSCENLKVGKSIFPHGKLEKLGGGFKLPSYFEITMRNHKDS